MLEFPSPSSLYRDYLEIFICDCFVSLIVLMFNGFLVRCNILGFDELHDFRLSFTSLSCGFMTVLLLFLVISFVVSFSILKTC